MGLPEVRSRIDAACRRAGRDPSEVRLVAVTKGHGVEEIERRVLAHGCLDLGENRVQEWRDKAEALAERGVRWHLVGNLQRNKVKYLEGVALVHSLSSARLADELQRQAERRGWSFDALIEVNVAGEESKHGVAPEEAEALLRHAEALPHVRVRGLMTMAPYAADPEEARPTFRKLRELRDTLGLVELSMGMSGDFEVAVEEGATLVRVGSALFEEDRPDGPRPEREVGPAS